MELTANPLRFFLGSSGPNGFFNTTSRLYDPFDGWRTYLIKGGAGSGKSTLLKRIAAMVGESAEVFFCGADPRSLDAVCVPSKKLLVLDATAPHATEPHLWGACEQLIPLSLCADETRLYDKREAIIRLSREQEACHRRSRRLLNSATALLAQNRRTIRDSADDQAVKKMAARIRAHEWERTDGEGHEDTRLLSAITPDGLVTLFETVQTLCPRIYAVYDEHGALAHGLLHLLKTYALADGQHVVVSPSPLFPDTAIDHLWLPQLGTAFITANRLHSVDFPVYRRLHTTRFLDDHAWQQHRNQLAFRGRAAEELLNGAAAALAEARTFHAELEQLTADATDFDAVTRLSDTFLERMGL